MDVELWQLRYVVAVADERNFTRAAARLHISQPALSTRIRELEQRLGFALFERTSRAVTLTPAGEVVVEHGRRLLADATAAIHAAKQAATASPVVRVGVLGTSSAVLFPLVAALVAEQDPGRRLEPRQLTTHAELEAGDVDVAFTRLEIDETTLELAPLLRERRVLAMASSHPLASAESLMMAELAGESFITQRRGNNPKYRARWVDEQLRHGLSGAVAREVSEAEELMALLAAGRGVCLVPATAARYYARPGISYVPVVDAETVPISLAWRPGTDPELVDTVIGAARMVASELVAEADHWLAP
ncbi:MAG: LysR family transcriptional regulator [Solirubrobacteraceae bacterium]|nr:LysR family transcriptional regulator [Solirubrobacteraceae bacterium]